MLAVAVAKTKELVKLVLVWETVVALPWRVLAWEVIPSVRAVLPWIAPLAWRIPEMVRLPLAVALVPSSVKLLFTRFWVASKRAMALVEPEPVRPEPAPAQLPLVKQTVPDASGKTMDLFVTVGVPKLRVVLTPETVLLMVVAAPCSVKA